MSVPLRDAGAHRNGTREEAAVSQGIAVVGAGEHAKVVIDAIRADAAGPVVGISSPDYGADTYLGAPVFHSPAALADATGATRFVVAIGDNHTRWRVTRELTEAVPGAELVTVVHPSATVAADVTLGPGTVVFAGAVVNSGSRIGEGVILNTACSVDHDARLGDYASIAPGAVLGGKVTVGERAAVSIGVSLANGRTVGADAVVGAGAVVVEDVPPEVVAYGVPARVVRSRKPDEPYL